MLIRELFASLDAQENQDVVDAIVPEWDKKQLNIDDILCSLPAALPLVTTTSASPSCQESAAGENEMEVVEEPDPVN